jgi:methionyl-tRNA formyltransferase
MAEKTIEPQPQNHQDATYTRPLSKGDGRIEWQKDAYFLSRFVRAMNPWPVAFSYLFGEAIRVWAVRPEGGIGRPGVITALGEEGILVGTGQGLLRLLEVQAPGKKRMPGAEFARGRRLKEGDRFEESR